tara:strand:+ start:283 stop:507 length:225 start_codon:yes stop_codon:yes gene_type:complete
MIHNITLEKSFVLSLYGSGLAYSKYGVKFGHGFGYAWCPECGKKFEIDISSQIKEDDIKITCVQCSYSAGIIVK